MDVDHPSLHSFKKPDKLGGYTRFLACFYF